ncbi:hypothetical protein [Ktedonospora formicarum]|uniref:Adhesin domain-containing protein n=1 Tax=Ktedonospora formicarum TaxID=2778364 RepID=A0A8J3I6S1_9CHLR|nr:hypothetical protein [Ktedonospora formicarum]GHO46474.1 hypothetical protein KSX_46370 [Ktedonospora formicarum]
MAMQTFPIMGKQPWVFLENIEGNLTVLPWERREIAVETEEPIQDIRQEGDTIRIQGYRSHITLRVPFIRVILNHLTTSISASRLSGNVQMEKVGSVELRQVSGNVYLEETYGSVRLEELREQAQLHFVGGSLTAINAPYVRAWGAVGGSVLVRNARLIDIDNIGGSLNAQDITEKLLCKHVGGSAEVTGCHQAEVEITAVGGSANIDGAASLHSIAVGGSAKLEGLFALGNLHKVAAGGSAILTLPAESNVSVKAVAGGSVGGSALNRSYNHMANVVYGDGRASLFVTAGGRVALNGDIRPTRG